MRVFAGNNPACRGEVATASLFIYDGELSPLLSTDLWTEFVFKTGSGHALRKSHCSYRFASSGRLFDVCIWLGWPGTARFLSSRRQLTPYTSHAFLFVMLFLFAAPSPAFERSP
jgi:hypothetical protein